VRCVHAVYSLRMRKMSGTNRYVLLGVVGAIAALVQYPLRLFRLDPRSAINEFFSADNLETLSSLDVILLLLVKFPLVVVSIGLPIPAGVFIPSFLLGSGLGRLYGEALRLILGTHIVAGGYAVVGAAAFTAGVTRAMSCAVIIFEVTGQLKHMEPTLVAVVLSVLVGNCINRSLYDTLIIMKELPYMPHMRRDRSPAQDIGEVMHRNVVAVKQNTTLGNIREILEAYPHYDAFPVTTEGNLLLGSVRRRSLIAMLTAVGNDDLDSGGIVVDATDDLSDPELSSMGMAGVQVSSGRTKPRDVTVDNDITAESNGGSGASGEAYGNESDLESVAERLVLPADSKVRAPEEDAQTEYSANKEATVIPDLSPLIFPENTALSQVHFMFVMLMPSHAFVLSGGRLAGVVTRGDIVQTGAVLIGDEPQPP
jgi:CBS domain-containing protein